MTKPYSLSRHSMYFKIDHFQADRNSFLKFPNTRLGKLMSCKVVAEVLKLCEEFIPGENFILQVSKSKISGDPPEFFFDKNPENFASVLEMYRSGKFHIPDGGRGRRYLRDESVIQF